jgi:CheY-like chemotaxis protein
MVVGRILVVDDDPDIAQVLAEVLALEGHAVTRCGSGEAALAAAEAAPPDLVLLDLRMPGPDAGGLDGLRVADVLARNPQTWTIPVVLMTAVSPQERGPWGEVLAERTERVLFKPFLLDELLGTVADLLDGRHVGGPCVAG